MELRFSCNRGSGVRRGAGGPAAHPEPARDLRPSVLAVQVADHQPHRLCGQMPGAAPPGRPLSRRRLHLQKLERRARPSESSDLDQINHGSHGSRARRRPLSRGVGERRIVIRINIHGRSGRDAV